MSKTRMGKRVASLLLSLVMMLSLLPTTVYATGETQDVISEEGTVIDQNAEDGNVPGEGETGTDDPQSAADNAEGEEDAVAPQSGEEDGDAAPLAAATVAKIGEVTYDSLDAAIEAVKDGEIIVVSAGEHKLPGSQSLYTGKEFTIEAAEDATVSFDMSTAVTLGGAKITFNGVTFDYKTNNDYTGLQHADTLVYNDCTINGKVFLYASSETFNNCVFNQSAVDYNVWTYGAKQVAFNSCTFNCAGKSVLVYTEDKNASTDLTVNNTTFTATEEVTGKAAIEIDTSLMTNGGATITIDGATTATGFAGGSNSGNSLWNNKKPTKENNKNITVTVADVVVLAPKAYVAEVGGTGYATLAEAVAAAKDGETIVVSAGEYKLPGSQSLYTGKEFTIEAAEGATVSFDMSTAVTLGGAKITFNGVTFDYKTNNDYTGLQHADTLVYNDCTINGKVFLYASSETFNNCVFNQEAVDYNVWTYGAKKVEFNSCTFKCAGKSVLVYTEDKNASTDLTVNNTTFTATEEVTGKAAIEIDTSLMTNGGATITIDGATTATGFAKGSNSGSTLWNNKKPAADANENITVTVADVVVLAPKTELKGTETNPYTLDEFGAMTRDDYITAQEALNGTMYVDVGDYVYDKYGTLGNGERDDTVGQKEDRTVLNGYNSNGYLGEKNDGANDKNVVFVGSSITSGATGYTSIDNIGTYLLLAVPAYTHVTFKGITFHNVFSFEYQLYTSPWSQLSELNFENCTFDGLIVGSIAAQSLRFNECTFNSYTNNADANNSNPTWIRPAYGNWTKGDNEGQGDGFRSLTRISFTNNTVASTRPVKFERIAQWEMATAVTATGNRFDMSKQAGDSSTKNVGMYFGANAKFDLVADNNIKEVKTAALYTAVYSAPNGTSYAGLPAGSTVKDSENNDATLTDAYEWKSENKLTLKTTAEVAQLTNAKGVAVNFATLAEAIAAAKDGETVKLLADCESGRINLEDKSVKVDLNGKTLTSTADYGVMFCAKNGYTITIDGTTEGSKLVGTLMVTSGTYGHIVINGGTYESAQYCPIYVNGAVSSDKSTVTITNATVTALKGNSDQENGVAMYLAGYAKYQFKNVEVTAPVTGIEIRAGELTLDNCNVTGGSGTIEVSENGNGTTVKNAALAISQHNTEKKIAVTITDGAYTGTAALYQTDVQGTGSADVKVEVESGTFNGSVKAETDKTIAISGGTFDKPVEDQYCAEGFIPKDNSDGTYGVEAGAFSVEVWTGFSGTKVQGYTTIEKAAANLGSNKWLVIAKDYMLNDDFTIPEGVYLDVAKDATLTVAENVTLTVAADAKRLGVRAGATVVNNGTIMVCGTNYSNGFVMLPGTLTGNALSVPEGHFLDNNGNNFFATANEYAVYEITFADGTVKKTVDSTNIKGGNVTQVKLLKNVENVSLTIGNDITLDLGGHTFNYRGQNRNHATLNITNKKVTIKNGTVSYGGTDRGAIDLSGGELIIESNAVIEGGKSYGIYTGGTSKLTVNGTVTGNGYYAIAGNGSETSGSIDNCDITVNEGAVISATNGIGIYHPQLGTVTVNGGTITGHTGIQMCAGKLVVTGGEITSTGDNKDYTGSQNAMMDGAAISIVNRNYPGGIPTAEITGGTFKATGEDALAIRAYDYTSSAVADWAEAGEHVNISGGTFSSIPENMAALCKVGYVAVKNDEGAYVVQEKQTYVVEAQSRIAGTNSSITNVIGGGQISNAEGTTLTANSVSGYTFLGWYVGYTTNNNGTLVSKERSFLYTPTADVTLTAVYQPVSGGTAKLMVNASRFTITGKSATQKGYQTYTLPIGSLVTVEYTDANYTFLYWTNGSEKVVSKEKEYSFTLGSNTTLSAVVADKETEQHEALVVFMSAYEQVMSAQTYSTEDTIEFPVGPSKMGNIFVGWSMTEAEIKAAMANQSYIVVKPLYEATGEKYAITVRYEGIEKANETYELAAGESKLITAEETVEGKSFQYWKDANGAILSYRTSITVINTSDVTVTAVYGENETQKAAVVKVTGVTGTEGNSKYTLSFSMRYALLDGQELVSAGFVATNDANKAESLDIDNYTTKRTTTLTTSEGIYTLAVNVGGSGTMIYCKAFLQYKDANGVMQTLYSDVISASYDSLSMKGE